LSCPWTQFISNQQSANLLDLIRLCQVSSGLDVHDLLNIGISEDMVAAPDSLDEAETQETLA
jgi:hypothetical protein